MEKPTQLELRHLAAYLPYGLKGIFTNLPGGLPFELQGINIDDEDGEQVIKVHGVPGRWGGQVSEIRNIKPILRPLTECEQYLNIEGGIELDSSLLALNGSLNSINIYPDGSEWTHSIDVYNNVYQWLFEHHFDVFGLIDASLAVDINNINQ
jgi:hypothetical protein